MRKEKKKIYLLIGTYRCGAGYDILHAYISRELAEQGLEYLKNFSDKNWVIEEVEIFDVKEV